MAFGEHSGNHWLVLPGIGIVVLGASLFDIIPDNGRYERFAIVTGLLFLLVGTVLAGLIGHIGWLVPLALLICVPVVIAFSVCERIVNWRENRRRRGTTSKGSGASKSRGK